MDIEGLIHDPQLKQDITKLKAKLQQPQHAISDIIDDEGNQYVDLVMEGGGMLGIALVGYTWALEEMGIRFLGIGGTSAGSINALLLAGMAEPSQPKSPRLLKELAGKNFYDFVDGGKDVRELIELALGGKQSFKGLRMFWKFMQVKEKLCKNYGLNQGDAFLDWLAKLLADAGIHTLADLHARLAARPKGLRPRGGQPFGDDDCPRASLVIVAADVTTETRVEFPRMANLYWAQPEKESPARFARASMSIPFFFEPLRVANVPGDDAAKQRWKEMAGYDTDNDPTAIVPTTALFVDGGIMSNFPIDAFHETDKVPRMPTFGVKLEYDQRYKPPAKLPIRAGGDLKHLGPLAGAILNSSRHTLDYEFIKKNPDYQHLVQFIPCTYTDPKSNVVCGYNWLDFNMPEEHKKGLFKQGALKAIEFIDAFSGPVNKKGKTIVAGESPVFESKWAFYKNLRKCLLEMS